MAQQLVEQGQAVTLVMMDTWHPSTYRLHRYRVPMTFGLPLFLLWRTMGIIPRFLRLPVKDWIPFLRRKTKRLLSLSRTDAGHDELMVEFQVEHVTRATLQAVARYDVRKYPGRILNIVASKRNIARSITDTRHIWPELGGEGSKTVLVSAINSGQLLVTPHIEEVMTHLRAFHVEDTHDHPQGPLAA